MEKGQKNSPSMEEAHDLVTGLTRLVEEEEEKEVKDASKFLKSSK